MGLIGLIGLMGLMGLIGLMRLISPILFNEDFEGLGFAVVVECKHIHSLVEV